MKLNKMILSGLMMAAVVATTTLALAASSTNAPGTNTTAKAASKLKPYTLTNCVVSGDKIGGAMGSAFVFEYKGREIKMCCPDCKKDFDKDPAKYIKLIEAAEKKAAEDAAKKQGEK